MTQLPSAVGAAWKLLLKWQPEAVLGVGGYASASGVMAAGLLGIPWILQEQNSIPGWTNHAFSPWADAICCGFKDALKYFPSRPAIWTGNPVRSEFFSVPDIPSEGVVRILILGGSQGSLFLNRTLPRVLSSLLSSGNPIRITHQTGSRWHEVVRTAYKDVGLEARLEAFFPELWENLGESDLVIARSGALTISELEAAGRGALLLPFADAAGNHQEFNARSMEAAGAAVVIRESEATTGELNRRLGTLISDRAQLIRMGRAARMMALPNAGEKISEILLSLGSRA
jgi:UDP-N-acetylglucosamine--N-acetylmuramyl-(pentapeptide) pyrophosphoryl-undecaprenol N-acetylglucosamine transferase